MTAGWSGRRALVTGADGFIGSHMVEALVHAGANVTAFCFYNSNSSYGWLDHASSDVKEQASFILGDIRDAGFLEESLRNIDVVFHLAALISVPYSYSAPESFVETNVRGTLNVLNAVKKNGCARLVHTSTSEVYGTPVDVPIRESHALKGQSVYAASKIAADKMVEAFFCTYNLPVVTLRPFNTFGPRQSARALIPTILLQLLRGQTEVFLGNLEPRRDVTFVADTVRAFLSAGMIGGLEGKTIQLGTGLAFSVREVFEAACRVLGVEATIQQDSERMRPDKSEVMVLQSDPALAREVLGWAAEVPLESGLRQTAEWLRSELDRFPERYVV